MLSGWRWTPRLATLAMLGAIVIFGANFAISRYGTKHGLVAEDLVALRFGTAIPLLLPLFLRRGLRTCAGIGWRRGIALVLTSGAPMNLLMTTGLTYAPAAHGAALGPGTVTVVGVVYGVVISRVVPPVLTQAGLALVFAGLAAVALAGAASGSASVVFGDLCFFLTGLLWGFYPVLTHRWRIDPMTGAAVCAVLSLPYVVGYFTFGHPNLLRADPSLVLGQALFQGVINTIIGLWLWGSAIRVVGMSRTQLYPPLIPVVGALMAVPILGEVPGPIQAAGIVLIVGGLGLAAYSNRRAIRRLEAGPAAEREP